MKKQGIQGETADTIVRYITSFALYGFPESHSASFALIAYASAYLKVHYPAAFYAALLNNQPMGFYSAATLVKDAQHHGIRVRSIDVLRSSWTCHLEGKHSFRIGLCYVKGIRSEIGRNIVLERKKQGFDSLEDLQSRTTLRRSEMVALAEIGALNGFGLKRRQALWQVEKVCRRGGPLLKNAGNAFEEPCPLEEMNADERLCADYRGTHLTIGPHPMALRRKEMARLGVVTTRQLRRRADKSRVRVAGAVITRQRPASAKGFLFISLEDETGISNIIVRPPLFEKQRLLLVSEPFLIVEGILQNQENVISILGQKFWPVQGVHAPVLSHDFH